MSNKQEMAEFIQVHVTVSDDKGTIWDSDKYDIEEGDDVASILERMAEFLDKEAYGGGNEMLEKLLEEDFGLVADKPLNHKPKAGEHIQFNMVKQMDEMAMETPQAKIVEDGAHSMPPPTGTSF